MDIASDIFTLLRIRKCSDQAAHYLIPKLSAIEAIQTSFYKTLKRT